MISNEDITVVAQGPIQALPDRDQDQGITHRSLASVREHLPGARLILSTWPDQDLSGLDYDELVISDDPGPNIIGYRNDGSPRQENYNRQIVSSLAGLRRVTTRYAMKLRADNYLTGDQFKRLQQAYPKRCASYRFLTERVVVNNTFTREYAKGQPVAFHACDFFYFGLTADVLAIWDLPLFEDYPFDPAGSGRLQHHGMPHFAPDATQHLWLRCLNKFLDQPLSLRHMTDVSGGLLEASRICYANNLVVGGPEDISLGLPSKFIGAARAASKGSQVTYLSYKGWQLLYRKYCDPDFAVAGKFPFLLSLWLWRALLMPGKRLEAKWKVARNRMTLGRRRDRRMVNP